MRSLKATEGKTRLKNDIYDQITTGVLRRNDRLLAEEKLSRHYGLGIKIVRSALSELEEEGIIVRKKRIGTFVQTGHISNCRNVSVVEFEMSSATAYHAEIFAGIERIAGLCRCAIQINPIRRRSVRGSDSALLRQLIYEGKIDGLLLLSWLAMDEIESLLSNNIPFVTAGFEYRDLQVPAVLCDYRAGIDRIVKVLLSAGHQRIGMIIGSTGVQNASVVMAHEKLSIEFAAILERLGLYDPALIKKGLFTERDGYWLMRELLECEAAPSAIISCGNELTNGATKALYEAGATGKKTTLFPLSDCDTVVPRPQMKMPVEAIGARGMEMLISLIEGRELRRQRELLAGEILY